MVATKKSSQKAIAPLTTVKLTRENKRISEKSFKGKVEVKGI